MIKAGIAIFMLFSFACSREKNPKDKQVKESLFSKSVRKERIISVATPSPREVPVTIRTSGKTQVSEKYQAKAPADIKVLKIFVEEGGKVQPGDPLIQFDDEIIKLRLNLARADTREAEAALNNVNYLIQNKEKLMEEGKVTETEAEGFDERLNWYQATAERSKAEIDLYEHTGDMSQINSPIGGLVTSKSINEGAEVTEGQDLLEVVRLDPMHFVFSVSGDEAPALSKMQNATVKFPLIPNQEFVAEVASVGAESKPEAGGVPIKFKINNPDFNLKGDMVGDVLIHTQGTRKVFAIPETSLRKVDKSYFVFKVDSGKAKKTFVELVEPPAAGMAVVTKGITEADSVISGSDDEVKDGDSVEIQTEEKKR